jgi:hypothetical protein
MTTDRPKRNVYDPRVRELIRATGNPDLYTRYYNEDRPHMSLDGDAPVSRAVEGASHGSVVSLSRVGGLHHRYSRAA